MSMIQQIGRVGGCFCVLAAIHTVGFAQRERVGNPFTGAPVADAPFSADATTTIEHLLSDGTRLDRRATARYYRDRAGRVRVEQPLVGLDAQSPAAERQVRITIQPDAADGRAYVLDTEARIARPGGRALADLAVGGGESFAVPLGGVRFLVFGQGERLLERIGAAANPIEEEPLGTRQISGLEVVGRRTTVTIPVGEVGNERPMQIVDERWESPELKIVIQSRHSDPRTSVIDYTLSNISRAEPPAALFLIPADYAVEGHGKWIELVYADPPRGAKPAPGGLWR